MRCCLGLIAEHCVFLLIRGLRVGFAVKDELRPAFIAAEHLQHFFVVAVVGAAGVHKRAVAEAVVLEAALVLLADVERREGPLVFQLERGLAGSVLDQTEHL